MNIVCDSDYLIAYFACEESTHQRALQLEPLFLGHDVYYLDIVHFESVTVVSRKYGYITAELFLEGLKKTHFTRVKYDPYEKEIWSEFYSHHKKNISFVDCANLVLARKLKAKIASFDSFYPLEILLRN